MLVGLRKGWAERGKDSPLSTVCVVRYCFDWGEVSGALNKKQKAHGIGIVPLLRTVVSAGRCSYELVLRFGEA